MAVDLDRKQKLYGIPGAGTETAFAKFTNNDLVGTIYYFDHKLQCKYPVVAIYDNNDLQVAPFPPMFPITPIDENRLQVDFTAIAPISGIWKIRVIGG